MIERVAKAICTKNCEWHRIECTGCDMWDSFEDSAHAAIAAMREPTDAMIAAGMTEEGTDLRSEYRAMIDAALSEVTDAQVGQAHEGAESVASPHLPKAPGDG